MASVALSNSTFNSHVRKTSNYAGINSTSKGCGGVLVENVYNRLGFIR